MFEVVACRLAGENARAISRNQVTFSHSSLPGSTVRRADAKETNQASRFHDSAIRESRRGFRRNDPLRGTRVVPTMTAGRKTSKDILIVRKTFALETGSSLLPVAKKKGRIRESGLDRIYLAREFIRTSTIDVLESRCSDYVVEI